MSVVADMLYCNCGGHIKESKNDIKFLDKNGNLYIIKDVPTFQCSECLDEYSPADVEFNLSLIADKMRKGLLPKETEYIEMF